ncbi:MAG: SufE family protein [Parachlamydiaceae bacterium]
MFESCLKKQENIKDLFLACPSEEARYEKIIELGRKQPHLNPKDKIAQNLVKGCQSQMYLHSYRLEDLIVFESESDALISAGLAALLIQVYSHEQPETILKCPPTYLDEIGIHSSLTPNRANGLYSMHLKMKQDALKLLLEKESLEKNKI